MKVYPAMGTYIQKEGYSETTCDTGATFYAEQYMMGEKAKYNGKITESIPGEKITMTFSFPLSLITEKITC